MPPFTPLNSQASGIAPDKFSYSMALTACSAGLWSGDLWSSEDGWGPEEENTSAGSRRSSEETPQNEEEQGGNLAACRGMHAIEVKIYCEPCMAFRTIMHRVRALSVAK